MTSRNIIKLSVPRCSNTYGSSPCTASGSGDEKCYQTYKTCADKENFNLNDSLDLYFIGSIAALPTDFNCIPYLESVRVSPPVLQVTGLALQNKATVSIADFAHSDRLDVDKYLADRTFDPMTRGTFWPRFLYRFEYELNNAKVNLYFGEVTTLAELNALTSYEYLLKSWSLDDTTVSLSLADKLSLLEPNKAKSVVPSKGKLANNIGVGLEYITIDSTDLDEYPSSGVVRIDDEFIGYSYRAGELLTAIDRGRYGSTIAEHDQGAGVQLVTNYALVTLPNFIEQILELFIDSADIDDAQIDTELASFYSAALMTGRLSDPGENLQQVINDFCDFFRIRIFDDPVSKKIKINALTPNSLASVATFTDDNIIKIHSTKLSSEHRITRYAVYHNVRDHSQNLDATKGYDFITAFSDEEAGGEFMHGQHSSKIHFGRWLDSCQQYVNTMISRTFQSFKDDVWEVSFDIFHASLGSVALGDHITLSTDRLLDQSGQNLSMLMWVRSIVHDYDRGTVRILAQQQHLVSNYSTIGSSTLIKSASDPEVARIF